MSAFDDRWRRLTSAARRAPERPRAALRVRIVLPPRAPPLPSIIERLALRSAFAVGALAYAVAAWLLPLAMDGGAPAGPMVAMGRPSLALLPAPPRLPPPRPLFAAIGDAIASLAGGIPITGAADPAAAPPSPGTSL